MTAKRDESDNRSEQSPKPSLTGDRRLDKALEKLRRTLEAKKEATKQSAAANGRENCLRIYQAVKYLGWTVHRSPTQPATTT
jgi:hypothetical protein